MDFFGLLDRLLGDRCGGHRRFAEHGLPMHFEPVLFITAT